MLDSLITKSTNATHSFDYVGSDRPSSCLCRFFNCTFCFDSKLIVYNNMGGAQVDKQVSCRRSEAVNTTIIDNHRVGDGRMSKKH